ncbi:glycogen/starch synthase [Arenibacter sp. GZD96]|uniref:glycogen synthase n=1 Tax=Aurantibrevibacter litoralis TaxID=3106030 RepID=UPI002AFF74DF|nr:glycogen/starch synthase [Arenibacter sp. GZD-96]MEA1787495.1 glycogen/starch synthase [Arenibacter sp. GZD-96]
MIPNFLFVSAENDALANCKAGGMGDVVRDVPIHIALNSHSVSTVVPSYGRLHKTAQFLEKFTVSFRGTSYLMELYKGTPKEPNTRVSHYVLHHADLTEGNIAHIYQHDENEPFYTDANKFSLFCVSVAQLIQQGFFGKLDVIHLHDWHTALLLFLKEFHPAYAKLKESRFAYTIHNLAIQGIRPLEGNYSSLQAWFPEVSFDPEWVQDPRYRDCVNLMGLGIRYADAVHTVSPSYKQDILLPSEQPYFIGGEGLEALLQKADREDRLFGILNGIDYTHLNYDEKPNFYEHSLKAIYGWLSEEGKKYKADFLIHTGKKLSGYLLEKPKFLMASVARLTEQKFYFFKQYPAIFDQLLAALAKANGVYVLLGTGDPAYETFFREASYAHNNFVFINGQSEAVVKSIYAAAHLYLMPSLFEPCGICQMLAMRNGNPCLVHNTGGLKDTVGHGINGFTFDGKTSYQKAINLVKTLQEAIDMYFNQPEEWQEIKENAKSSRFGWESSVNDYYRLLYHIPVACAIDHTNSGSHPVKATHFNKKEALTHLALK